MREAINLIANKYGYELQSRQCIEELSELIQAICKDKRKRTATSNNSEIIKPISKFSETGSHVIEEIADVEIMLEQLKLLMDCSDEVEKVKISKINRQLERIGVKLSQQEKDNNNGWILVKEKMPPEHDSIFAKLKGTNRWIKPMFEKTSDRVQVTVEDKNGKCITTTATTVDGQWRCDLLRMCKDYKITAWQPLSEPYEEGERE